MNVISHVSSLRKTKTVLSLVAILAGVLQAWSYRWAIDPDGLNYLDLANAYARHDWANAVNAYWSPLYSWVLALALWLTRAPLYWESTVLHIVNIFLYVFALYCFSLFIDELAALSAERAASGPGDPPGYPPHTLSVDIPPRGLRHRDWLFFGYALFVYAALELNSLQTNSADIAMAGFVFLATAILIRMRRGNRSYALFAALGATLGVSYLAKGVMFPLSFVFLAVAFVIAGAGKKALYRAALAFLIFAGIAGLFVIPLSRAKGRFTFGDTGKIAYAIYVNGLPTGVHFHWQGEVPGGGSPVHGVRLINLDPPVAEFATPIHGTYPPYYDPSYWYEGARPHFDLSDQIGALRAAMTQFFTLLSAEKEFLTVLILLLLFSGDWPGFVKTFGSLWPVWIPAVATLGIYALVLVEPRYIMSAIVILWCVLFAAVRFPESEKWRRLLRSAALALALILAITVAKSAVSDIVRISRLRTNHWWPIAMALREHGLAPGDKVAVIGHANIADYWAHLAQLRVVADIPLDFSGRYWGADSETQSRVRQLIAGTGARAIVTRDPPVRDWQPGWHPIGNTGYAVFYLDHRLE